MMSRASSVRGTAVKEWKFERSRSNSSIVGRFSGFGVRRSLIRSWMASVRRLLIKSLVSYSKRGMKY